MKSYCWKDVLIPQMQEMKYKCVENRPNAPRPQNPDMCTKEPALSEGTKELRMNR